MHGLHSHPDDDEVTVDRVAGARADALDGVGALEGGDGGPGPHPHAVVEVDVAVGRAHFVAEHALERDRLRVEHGDVQTALRAHAATSEPIHPAPTTTSEPPRSSRSRSASQSVTLRR